MHALSAEIDGVQFTQFLFVKKTNNVQFGFPHWALWHFRSTVRHTS